MKSTQISFQYIAWQHRYICAAIAFFFHAGAVESFAWWAKLHYAEVMPYLALDLPGLGNSRQITGSHHHRPAMEISSTSCCDSVIEHTRTHIIVRNRESDNYFSFCELSITAAGFYSSSTTRHHRASYITISFLVVSSIMYLVQSFQFS